MKRRILKKIIRTLGEGRTSPLTHIQLSVLGGLDEVTTMLTIANDMPWVKRKYVDRYNAYLRYCNQHHLHYRTFYKFMQFQNKHHCRKQDLNYLVCHI